MASQVFLEPVKHRTYIPVLPPNATHLLQTLDVAISGPPKKSWKAILSEWKMKNRGVIPKSVFHRLLKKAIETNVNIKYCIQSGFRAFGIFPLNREIVINKISNKTDEEQDAHPDQCTQNFKEFLQESRS